MAKGGILDALPHVRLQACGAPPGEVSDNICAARQWTCTVRHDAAIKLGLGQAAWRVDPS
jgi:hypothetical protein